MKLLHTADWHLGKLVQGVYMTEDQEYILEQLVEKVAKERPDAVIVAGDLYDRAVPPAEAVQLLDRVLERIVLQLKVPVLAIAGNHDSPSRLDFGSGIMKASGFHIAGELTVPLAPPVVLRDEFGEVHVHLLPYAEPGKVRHLFADEEIRTHDEAMARLVQEIRAGMDPGARHVLVGHAFVTPHGEAERNTSDSERPLAIGGAEHVRAELFDGFAYVALGHLHQAHHVSRETIRYAGSPLKYSISEERHAKGYTLVELDGSGVSLIEHRTLEPRRDMRTVEGLMADIERQPINEDYVFVRLVDETPVLSAMERVRAVYPNAMHVERKAALAGLLGVGASGDGAGAVGSAGRRAGMDALTLFKTFYEEVRGMELSETAEKLFVATLQEIGKEEGERDEAAEAYADGVRAV
jgi:exonuclease SbcD